MGELNKLIGDPHSDAPYRTKVHLYQLLHYGTGFIHCYGTGAPKSTAGTVGRRDELESSDDLLIIWQGGEFGGLKDWAD